MRKSLCIVLVLALLLGLSMTVSAAPASEKITTTPTGYKSPSDIIYFAQFIDDKMVKANWGARGEDCVFLTYSAQDYYMDDYAWEAMSALAGGTGTGDAPSSELYSRLQDLMEGTHSFYTYYDGSKNVRDFYCFTDCVSTDIEQVSLLYRGDLKTSEWNSGDIWNQEHVWPKSKLNTDEQIGDIMLLRPANPSENSSRGNDAYGESGGYYDPGVSVRGDCARMVLYMYVRWGMTSNMWGKDGVIESLDILLKWMEEDPVDTWEMGRNDSVQSITGVRNVFVDYPEYAWLLFGQEVPADMVTPSCTDEEEENPECPHFYGQRTNEKAATCGEDGYTGDIICADCGEVAEQGTVIPATGEHTFGDWVMDLVPNGDAITTQHHDCEVCGFRESRDIQCTHMYTEVKNKKEAGCKDGYTGDTYCADCGELLSEGTVLPATGEHLFGAWIAIGNENVRVCTLCNLREAEPMTGGKADNGLDSNEIYIIVVLSLGLAVIVAYLIFNREELKKKKKNKNKKKKK